MYKQLSREQRYAIYLGLQEKKTKTAIARQIGCSVSTVCREIARNSNRHERIYREIHLDKTGELRRHCRHKLKYRRHTANRRPASGKTMIPNRISIHQRPAEADGRRFGDWEMDLVIGIGQKSAVLTVIERSTNMFFQTKVASKQPRVVAQAAFRLLFPYKAHVLTITTDNGSEFMNHEWLTSKLGTTVYFADPFCSGQKGPWRMQTSYSGNISPKALISGPWINVKWIKFNLKLIADREKN